MLRLALKHARDEANAWQAKPGCIPCDVVAEVHIQGRVGHNHATAAEAFDELQQEHDRSGVQANYFESLNPFDITLQRQFHLAKAATPMPTRPTPALACERTV
jgi:hypothetical protein